jgi:hypothetical protein
MFTLRTKITAIVVLLALSIIAAPFASAQINIPPSSGSPTGGFTGGFTSSNTCPFIGASIPPGCLVVTNGNATTTTDPTYGNVLRLTPSAESQIGSAWSSAQQQVSGGFTTTFQFRFSSPSEPPADGIAFVIQNSSLGAIGAGGGSIGYGGSNGPFGIAGTAPPSPPGISNSLAIEFDTYNNGTAIGDPNGNHVAVQSCETGPNTSWHNQNCDGSTVSPPPYGNSNHGIQPSLAVTLSDGNYHTVRIQYNPPGTPCAPSFSATANLCISIDQFAAPVLTTSVDLSSIGLSDGGGAYVGFTSATGLFYETHDILDWSFSSTPTQTQTETLSTTVANTFNFNTTPSFVVTHVVDYTQTNANTSGITLQSQDFLVSNGTGWPPYVVGTPYAPSHLFLKNGDNSGSTDYGSIYVDTCYTATSKASDSNCPVATSLSSPIIIDDIWDLSTKPTIASGTTTALVEYVQSTTPTTDWNPAPASVSPNPTCTNTLSASFACDLSDIMVDFSGDPTSSGTTTKKGTFATLYNVPMLTTAASVNTIPVNPTAPIYVRGNLTFDFLVTPAQFPGNPNGFTAAPVSSLFYAFGMSLPPLPPSPLAISCPAAGCIVVGATQPGTSSTLPVKFEATQGSPADGSYTLQWSAVDTVGIRERNVQLTGATYSTTLFSAQVVVDNTAPTISAPVLSAPSGTSVTATYSCYDALSGIVSCGPHSLATPIAGTAVNETYTLNLSMGTYPAVTLTAVDAAGNTASTTLNAYTVYGICALYDQTKAVKSGATIPIKLYLCSGSTDLSAPSITVHAVNVLQTSSSTTDPIVSAGNANPDSDFRYDATQGPSGGYIFNLKTSGLGTGNYVIQFTVTGDPTLHSLAFGVR